MLTANPASFRAAVLSCVALLALDFSARPAHALSLSLGDLASKAMRPDPADLSAP